MYVSINKIFPIPEIENIIFDYLDPLVDLKQISKVSHYYHDTINDMSFWIELREFTREKTYSVSKMIDYCGSEANVDEWNRSSVCNGTINSFTRACFFDKMSIAKYLFSSRKFDLNFSNKAAFRYACAGPRSNDDDERWKIILWLHNLTDNIYNATTRPDFTFLLCCRHDNFDIAIWYFNLCNPICSIYAFKKISKHGNFDMALWLCIVGTNRWSVRDTIKIGYRYGHLATIIYLYEFHYEFISNIYKEKYLDVMIWAYNKFNIAPDSRDIGSAIDPVIIIWMMSLRDDYEIISVTDRIIQYRHTETYIRLL